MLKLVFFLLYLALVVYALVDVIQADEEDLGGIQKGFWIIAIVFLPLAGSIAWIVVSNGARRRRASSGGQVTGFPASQPAPAQYSRRVRSWEEDAPVAPEDDPEFIWLMEQAKRKRERQAREGAARTEDAGPEGDDERQRGEGHAQG